MSARARIIVAADRAEAARRAAEAFATAASETLAAAPIFRVALAGGSTPKLMLELLALPDENGGARTRVDWQRVEVFFGDERRVPPDDSQSNYRMASEALLAHVPIPPTQIHRIEAEREDVHDAAQRYAVLLRQRFGLGLRAWPRFDLILLGLGPDAHTASLFPETAALDERESLVVANWVPTLGTFRITLTSPVLSAAARVVFLACGDDKASAVTNVLEGPHRPIEYPAQLVQPANPPLWVLDRAAASRLSSQTIGSPNP